MNHYLGLLLSFWITREVRQAVTVMHGVNQGNMAVLIALCTAAL